MRETKSRPPFRQYLIARNKPADCTECPDRPVCTELCPDVERWVNQDFVGTGVLLENEETGMSDLGQISDESVLGSGRGCSYDSYRVIKSMKLTDRNIEFIRMFYLEGKRKCEIARELNVSDQIVDVRHKSVVAAVKNRLLRMRAYDNLKHFEFESEKFRDIARLYFRDFTPVASISESVQVGLKRVYTIISTLWMVNNFLDMDQEVGGDD